MGAFYMKKKKKCMYIKYRKPSFSMHANMTCSRGESFFKIRQRGTSPTAAAGFTHLVGRVAVYRASLTLGENFTMDLKVCKDRHRPLETPESTLRSRGVTRG